MVCVCVYIYIYIYIQGESVPDKLGVTLSAVLA